MSEEMLFLPFRTKNTSLFHQKKSDCVVHERAVLSIFLGITTVLLQAISVPFPLHQYLRIEVLFKIEICNGK